MRYRLLGPLQLSDEHGTIDVTSAKQRSLLTVLLLNANRVVQVERLIDALWDENPPETADKALQVHVSQLRKLLKPAALLTRSSGYELVVEPGELDLHEFELLVARAEAEPEDAAHLLREALELWRGPPLADVANERFARADVARLEELHVWVVEKRIEADLAAGRTSDLVGELEVLTSEHPLREGPRRQLMLALYRSGRQAEALEEYQRARRLLVEELGIDPGAELQVLHQAILNQDPSLATPASPTAGHDGALPRMEATTAPELARDGRKAITALFVGTTIASTRGDVVDPETLRRVVGRVLADAESAVARHGGSVQATTGETLTAAFGLPTLHEDDAARAIRAASEIRDGLTTLAAELAEGQALELVFGIGVSTGEVITDTDVSQRVRATGAPLGAAAQLGGTAAPGAVLFDQPTWNRLRGIAEAERDRLGWWRLLGVGDAAATTQGRLTSPMVGREREQRRLHDVFEQAAGDRSCQLVTVLGVAGVGKSRLVREFLTGLDGRARIARGRCLPYGQGITYWPLLEVVKEAVGLDEAVAPDDAQARLAEVLGGGREAERLAQHVSETIGLADVAGGAEERFAAVQTLFAALAHDRPLVVVFDDIHWAEPTFLDLVEHLADWSRDVPLVLVCLARPELLEGRPDWGGGKLNATVALLEPLSDDQCSRLLENLVGRAELAEEVGARIAEAAEGNPLFVEEMLGMLIEDGLLVREGSRWRATRDIADVRVPPTIQALLAARLDQLPANERAVLERAAVVGKVFQEGAVAELSTEAERPAAARELASLARKELIRPERASLGDRTYRFRHLLIRDAAYDSITKEVRAELHERFARWLERQAGERMTEYEEVIGHHLEQSYRYRAELGPLDAAAQAIAREAARRLGNAGRRAFVRSDAPAGATLISRAVAMLSPDDPLRVELVPNVRVVQGVRGDMSWADRVLTEAVEAAATTGDRRLAAHSLVQRGLLRLFTEPGITPQELIAAADRAIGVFEELDDQLGLARAWRLKAQAHYLARCAAACAEASERALEHVRRADDRFEEREIVEWLVIALLLGPAPAVEAMQRCERLLTETSTDPFLQAEILGALAPLAAMQGHVDQSQELMARYRAAMDNVGWVWISSFWVAFVSIWEGDAVAAETELLPAYEVLRTSGPTTSHFSSLAHALSTAVYAQGRYDDAERLTHECESASGPNDVHSQIMWRSIRAKVLARRGEVAAAKRLAEEAVAFAATSDFDPAHAECLMDLAEVHALAGDSDAAATAIEDAIGFYERKNNVTAAARARALLPAHA